MLDRFAKIRGRGVLHFANHKSADLRWRVLLATRFHPGIPVTVCDDLEGNIGEVFLHFRVFEFPADQPGKISEASVLC